MLQGSYRSVIKQIVLRTMPWSMQWVEPLGLLKRPSPTMKLLTLSSLRPSLEAGRRVTATQTVWALVSQRIYQNHRQNWQRSKQVPSELSTSMGISKTI